MMREQVTGYNLVTEDLDHILAHTGGLWEDLRGKRLFITGGTGFFGCWLLESFARANDKLGLNASILVLTRDYDAFRVKVPHLAANPAIRFHAGDVRNFDFPEGEFSHIIHAAATPAHDTFNKFDALRTFDIISEGARRTLDLAARCNAGKFLMVSSGAVYKQTPDITHVAEDCSSAADPTDPNSFLGESKRAAECLSALYARKHGFEAKIARCFSFVGPYLPLDVHYAVGNFIRDAMAGGPIRVNGDGTPCRSYMYTADLVVWLWTILFRGESCRAYNVGSEEDVSIAELAGKVSASFPKPVEVRISRLPDPNRPPNRYVPSTKRARSELGLRQNYPLEVAIGRTIAYHESNRRP